MPIIYDSFKMVSFFGNTEWKTYFLQLFGRLSLFFGEFDCSRPLVYSYFVFLCACTPPVSVLVFVSIYCTRLCDNNDQHIATIVFQHCLHNQKGFCHWRVIREHTIVITLSYLYFNCFSCLVNNVKSGFLLEFVDCNNKLFLLDHYVFTHLDITYSSVGSFIWESNGRVRPLRSSM